MIERDFPNGSVSYDREADAVYVQFGVWSGFPRRTVSLVPSVNIDVDDEGYIMGVEILG